MWGIAKCPLYRGVLISGVSFKRASAVQVLDFFVPTSGRWTKPNSWGSRDLLVSWREATTDSWTVQLPKSMLEGLNSMSDTVTWARSVKGTGRVCVCTCVCRGENKALGLTGQIKF